MTFCQQAQPEDQHSGHKDWLNAILRLSHGALKENNRLVYTNKTVALSPEHLRQIKKIQL
jgi:hypothetical protein